MSNYLNDPERGSWSLLTSPNTNPYLPPEIWGQIFRFLSPRDLVSVADSCPEWSELLASEKKHALLKLVLPLLNVSPSDILTCREVSRGGKKMVDNLLQVFAEKRESFQFDHEESYRRRHFISKMQEIDRCSYNYLLKFGIEPPGEWSRRLLDRVGGSLGTNINPFLTRSIIIPLDVEGNEGPAIEKMLTLFGHHVWNLTACVKVDDDNGDPNGNHRVTPTKKFARLLRLVPNLKSLAISSGNWEPIETLSPDELPELKHLVSLNFNGWLNDSLEPVPYAFLLRYGRQLIELWDTCNNSLLQLEELTVEVLNELLPNLKKLRLRRTFGSALPKLMKVNWRLEELTLACFYGWTTKQIFDIISNFSQTLVQLQLKDDLHLLNLLKHVCYGGTDGHPCKTLPKLQVLLLDYAFDDVNKQDWFWNWVPMMFGHIKEIHFDKEYFTAPQNIEVNASKQIFLKLRKLDRILYWQGNRDGRKLGVHVRSDYALSF
ncbi:unnamed protein product [Orchesella dallaii]|uniref:F-box domain-containing protein n=1 Tax=Orchesella dallaii TaxID=48710 RepID=A0ABP1QGD1_9HEXA